jgi:hypothetical protein
MIVKGDFVMKTTEKDTLINSSVMTVLGLLGLATPMPMKIISALIAIGAAITLVVTLIKLYGATKVGQVLAILGALLLAVGWFLMPGIMILVGIAVFVSGLYILLASYVGYGFATGVVGVIYILHMTGLLMLATFLTAGIILVMCI